VVELVFESVGVADHDADPGGRVVDQPYDDTIHRCDDRLQLLSADADPSVRHGAVGRT
jgi:hypothetical protein